MYSKTCSFACLIFLISHAVGQILNDGKVLIHLCNYIEPWDDLSLSQKKSLNQRYQMGCGCKITTCYMVPCSITAPNECLWTDWLIERKLYGHQAKHYACIKRSDGTCSCLIPSKIARSQL
uniref:TIMP metallopeptidase inhibitor 4 n=1 Tax=Pavo cristatus TaxID=9049 RepID=A0A8C9FY13_PAVCR